ncbi:response regulator transcription factor [Anaerovorax odorimutans]|uniref:response regulator transcription factor n=1 Tax=Anaerovorax odorimutans TaxID=109327 RepID=UPI00040E46B7|nr:response regulator transcription factor [Anaerovorax odorimutans]
MAKIFVVDDEKDICKLIENTLTRDGHIVTCKNSALGLTAKDFKVYDIILLDVMMPEVDGFSFCRSIRQDVDCPIIFLTAKTMDKDVVEGLILGADDYIKKPFSLSELRARVSAHLRREHRERHQTLLLDNIRFDLSEKQIKANDNQIPLTKSEYEICELLARNRGQVFSLERILEQTFGFDSESDITAIRVHVKNIREKFARCSESPIETVWGLGYKWK